MRLGSQVAGSVCEHSVSFSPWQEWIIFHHKWTRSLKLPFFFNTRDVLSSTCQELSLSSPFKVKYSLKCTADMWSFLFFKFFLKKKPDCLCWCCSRFTESSYTRLVFATFPPPNSHMLSVSADLLVSLKFPSKLKILNQPIRLFFTFKYWLI